ncbi:hypothetical protein U8Y98_27485 [Priestia megaterium]|uniref:hypothetical protein n=1 Tax=Priestia megaterium TaxID=1404 RepID=UPI002FE00121
MKKKIFIWGMIGYFSVLFQLLSVQSAQALTQERKVDSTDNFSSSSSEELKSIFNRVYEEAYKLGEEDGYKGKIYESLYANQFSEYTSQEIDWFNTGYIVGYEKGKRKRREEITFLNEQEKTAGEQEGYRQGLDDYKHATVAYTPPQTPGKSKDWNKGFSLGYTKAIEIMDLSVKAKKDGHTQGLEGEALNMPDLYSADEITRKAYEEGFQIGQQEQLEKLRKEYKQEGFKQGYALNALSVPSGLSSEVATAFEQGYSKGEKQRHKDVRQEGFNAAFTYTTYHIPSAYQTNTRLLETYKEGFQSNKVANQLRKEAYEEGWKLGDTMTIPAKYRHTKPAVSMYKQYYELGKKKQRQTAFEVFIGFLVLVSISGAYTLFGRKRNRKVAFNLEKSAERVGAK